MGTEKFSTKTRRTTKEEIIQRKIQEAFSFVFFSSFFLAG